MLSKLGYIALSGGVDKGLRTAIEWLSPCACACLITSLYKKSGYDPAGVNNVRIDFLETSSMQTDER